MQATFTHRENAFTLLRWVLALSLVVWHFCVLTGKDYSWLLTAEACVQGFFILSGFLTAVSFERPFTLSVYARKRFLRTYAPYTVPVLLCFLAGAALTTLSATDYFLHLDTWRYLSCNLAFLNFLQPDLPGVFTHNPLTAVNGALWSMKVEVLFYCTVPLLYKTFQRRRPLPILLTLFLLSALYNEAFLHLFETTKEPLYAFLKRQIPGQYLYFCGGIMVYYAYDRLHKHMRLTLCVAAIIGIASLYFRPLSYINIVSYSFLLVWMAYKLPQYVSTRKLPNLTYGIYLYHFPVIQLLISIDIHSLAVAMAITLMLSWIAYRKIERPLMSKQTKIR